MSVRATSVPGAGGDQNAAREATPAGHLSFPRPTVNRALDPGGGLSTEERSAHAHTPELMPLYLPGRVACPARPVIQREEQVSSGMARRHVS